MTAPAPGWYPDANSPLLMRWWDGAAWTADTYERVLEPNSIIPEPVREPVASPVGPGQLSLTEDGVPLASWGRRVAARVIDTSLAWLLALAFGYRQVAELWAGLGRLMDLAQEASRSGQSPPLFASDARLQTALGVLSLLWLFSVLIIDLIFLRRWAATPGKLLLGLRVRRWTPSQDLTLGRILRRWLSFQVLAQLSVVGAIYSLLDTFWPLRDRRRQALHDRLSDTVVVLRVRGSQSPGSGA